MGALRILLAPALGLALLCPACGGDGDSGDSLHDRLGGDTGVNALATDVLARAYADPKVNGYFLNAPVDRPRLTYCLAGMISTADGRRTYPADCRSMAAAHQDLGVSTADFDDFMVHLDAAMTAASVSTADAELIRAALGGHRTTIVEDTENNATVYQRVGRKPAIAAVVDDFVEVVGADARINAFFQFDHARTKRCLVRLVCSIDGPCEYGQEVTDPAEAPLTAELACRDMATAHYGLVDPDSNPITYEHFMALVEDLATAMTDNGVAGADQTAILGVLGPLCEDIVSDPENCPASAAGPRPRRPRAPDATSAASRRATAR